LPSAAFVRAMKMSSAPDSEIPSVSDDYSYVNSIDYSLQYTADISKHMQMPDRLAAVDGFRKMNFHADPSSASFMNESPAFAMTIPDKLVLGIMVKYVPLSFTAFLITLQTAIIVAITTVMSTLSKTF